MERQCRLPAVVHGVGRRYAVVVLIIIIIGAIVVVVTAFIFAPTLLSGVSQPWAYKRAIDFQHLDTRKCRQGPIEVQIPTMIPSYFRSTNIPAHIKYLPKTAGITVFLIPNSRTNACMHVPGLNNLEVVDVAIGSTHAGLLSSVKVNRESLTSRMQYC